MTPTSKRPGLPVIILAPTIWERMSVAQRRRLMQLTPVLLKKPLDEAPTSDSAAASAAAALGYWLVPTTLSK